MVDGYLSVANVAQFMCIARTRRPTFLSNAMERTMVEVKPCPFCGNPPRLYKPASIVINDEPHYLQYKCDCRNMIFPSQEEAAKHWNERAE